MKLSGLIELIVLPLIWGTGILGAIQLQHADIGGEHSICGPWGCGPPTGALLAMHVGWLAVLGLPLLYLPFRLRISRVWVNRLAAILIAAGLLGVVAIIAWQWLVWLPQAGQWSREYIWQRCGFAVAAAVDFPFVQLVAIGLLLTVSNALLPSRSASMVHPSAKARQPSTETRSNG